MQSVTLTPDSVGGVIIADFDTKWIPEPNTGCRLWTAGMVKGYGVHIDNGSHVYAYRFAYEAEHGHIPDGLVIHHHCGVPACVYVPHLEAMTRAKHAQVHAKGQTHCSRGHERNEINSYVRPNGSKECRVCRRMAQRKG